MRTQTSADTRCGAERRRYVPGCSGAVGIWLSAIAGTMSAAPVAMAQEAADQAGEGQNQAASAGLEHIVVTGSRIARTGYTAPTPVTIVGAEALDNQAAATVIEYLDTLPTFSGNTTPESQTGTVSTGTAGVAALNLRDLGSSRTLVLINGHRSVGSSVFGRVDVNSIPSQLIDRVEIVTGGASAVYGSDAVAGVVNFILDTDFTGFAIDAAGGWTGDSENSNYDYAVTYGTPFADDRGHLILSGQKSYQSGILHPDGELVKGAWQTLFNPDYTPTNGEPLLLVLPHVSPATLAPGGLIVSGPLRGWSFGAGGEPFMLDFGPVIADQSMSGGDYLVTATRGLTSLQPRMGSDNLFARVSFDLTDDLNVYLQSKWNHTDYISYSYPQDLYYGGLTIQTDNPFIPQRIASQAEALGLTSFEMGTSLGDVGAIQNDMKREVARHVAGFDTSFDAFDTNWTWEGYYQYGVAEADASAHYAANLINAPLALDAVTDPETGEIVCRSTLTDPDNGCVPYNPFGLNVNSQRAIDYVSDTGWRAERFEQTALATSIEGEPFDNWAGSVSLAFGVAYRQESVEGSVADISFRNILWGGNYLPTFGDYDVTEGFVETVVPVAKDLPWAESLDLNAAARFTDYSTSGSIGAWKVGFSYMPISSDLRFRFVASRDIRAPNLSDLYNAGRRRPSSVVDPSTNQVVLAEIISGGNPDLRPELADTFGVGLVWRPSFINGLRTSLDYWSIDIDDAIDRYDEQTIADLCYQGNQELCQAINNGQPLFPSTGADINVVEAKPFNLASMTAKGVDLELTYQLPMAVFGGDIGLRFLGTRYLERIANDGVTEPNDLLGDHDGDGPPKWRYTAQATYTSDRVSATLGARGVSSGVLDNDYIECSSGCPASTPAHQTIDSNFVDGATYLDLALSYMLPIGDQGGDELEVFLNIRNVTDADPVPVPGGPSIVNFNTVPTNQELYDVGRVYRAGIRLRM